MAEAKEECKAEAGENQEILEAIGEPGRYQWILLPTICWCHISSVMQICFMVFGDVKPSWKCTNGTSLLIPIEGQNCTDQSPFLSVTSDFSLIGDLSYVPALMSSLQLIGALVGSLLVGQLADQFGRKRMLLIMVGSTSLLGIASGFAPNWKAMVAFRFFIGIFSGGYESVAVVYLLEGISRNRLVFEATIDAANSVGFAWLALIAWLTGDWKYLSFVAGLQVIPAFCVLLWAEETPRWLYQRGKINAANSAITKIARINRVIIDPLQTTTDEVELSEENEGKSLLKRLRTTNYLELFQNRNSVRFVLMLMFSFFVTGLVGYGLIFNVTNLLGNVFVNFALQGLLNMIPAVSVGLIERFSRFGRRFVHQTSLIGVAVCLGVVIVLMALNLQSVQFELLDAACLIGSMFSFPLWVVCNVYSAELFPTEVRNMANGVGNMAAKIGGVIAPQLVSYFFQFWNLLPFVVMTALCLINSIFAFLWLPETKGKSLTQAIDVTT